MLALLDWYMYRMTTIEKLKYIYKNVPWHEDTMFMGDKNREIKAIRLWDLIWWMFDNKIDVEHINTLIRERAEVWDWWDTLWAYSMSYDWREEIIEMIYILLITKPKD